jgi:ribosomal protein L7/L12
MIGQVTERATAMWDEGSRWDEILETLRAEGFSKVECIRATVEILRLPLADAKRIVHESRAWSDRRQEDDRLHEALEAEIRAEASGG